MKRCLTSLVIRETQSKTTGRRHPTLVRVLVSKIVSVGEDGPTAAKIQVRASDRRSATHPPFGREGVELLASGGPPGIWEAQREAVPGGGWGGWAGCKGCWPASQAGRRGAGCRGGREWASLHLKWKAAAGV